MGGRGAGPEQIAECHVLSSMRILTLCSAIRLESPRVTLRFDNLSRDQKCKRFIELA
jgi:hypothetical protein